MKTTTTQESKTMDIFEKGLPEGNDDQEKIVAAAKAFVEVIKDPTNIHIHDAFLSACEGISQATVVIISAPASE